MTVNRAIETMRIAGVALGFVLASTSDAGPLWRFHVLQLWLRPTGNLARACAEARMGMVFQHFNLFGHRSALENLIETPIRVYRQPPEQAREIGVRLLAGVGLGDHVDHLPRRLSRGQQQRVAIAWALALEPGLCLVQADVRARHSARRSSGSNRQGRRVAR